MLKLVGAEVFLVSIQPAEKELQASDDDHAGPLRIEGESVPVRRQLSSAAALLAQVECPWPCQERS